jgi:diadenosine tetraphosphate (Ap4A) HIT family hydrolase
MKTGCSICAGFADSAAHARVVYQDELWSVRHSSETNILGYFILESRRHILDLSEATDTEATAYGGLLKQLSRAMHEVLDCERIYSFSLGEAVPHYHLHLIPRRAEFPRAFRGRGIMSYPLKPAADASLVEEVCRRVRRALGKAVTSACR